MNIAIVGLGGVGGYFGAKLSKLRREKEDVSLYFIARNEHLEEVRKNGLTLNTADESITCKPVLATDNFNELPELDLVIISVKSYELENVVSELSQKIKEDTIIIPLLNGADIAERVRSIIGRGILLPACVYIISFIEKPGTVKQTGGSCLIYLGSESGKLSAEETGAEAVLSLFDRAGIRYKWNDDPRGEIWRKFLFIASFALVSGRYNAVIGRIMETPELSGRVKEVLREIKQIADAKEIALPDDVCEKAFELGYKFDYDSTTSFQRDFIIKDKPDERDIFGAAVIRMGRECGIKTETTELLYNEIESIKPGIK